MNPTENSVGDLDLIDEAAARRVIGGEGSPISRSALYAGVRRGFYPAPIKITARLSRWRRSELVAAVLARRGA